MKRLFKFKYPKLTLLLLFITFSYFIFSNRSISSLIKNLGDYSYIGILIAGMLFAFGFTAPFAIGFLITINIQNPLLGAIIGGIGATISNILIFKFIRFSFIDEFNNLEKTHFIKLLSEEIDYVVSKKIKSYLLFIFAGIIISSPLPDELGVLMLAGLTKIRTIPFIISSLIFGFLGILALLLL